MNSTSFFSKAPLLFLVASLLLPPGANAQALRRKGQFPPQDSVLATNDAKVQEGRRKLQACVAQVQADINRENAAKGQAGSPAPNAAKQVVIGAAVTVAGAATIVFALPIAVAIGGSAVVGAVVGGGGVVTFVGGANVVSGVNALRGRAAKFGVCNGVQFRADARNAIQPQ